MQQRLIACAAALTALAASVREQSSPAHLAHAVATGFDHVAQTIEHGIAKAEAVAEHFTGSLAGLSLSDADSAVLERAGEIAAQAIGLTAPHQVEPAPAAAAAPAVAQVSEQELAAVATAPRVTQADVDANIASEHYFTPSQALSADPGEVLPVSLSLLTICVLTLRNGFTVTGESACASPENFDPAIGKRLARENAVRKIWPLMGYELRSKLATA